MFWGFVLGVAVGVIFYRQIMIGVRRAVRFVQENTEDVKDIDGPDNTGMPGGAGKTGGTGTTGSADKL